MSHGLAHFEIPADDPDKLSEFYGSLFGWEINKVGNAEFEYWLVNTVPTDERGIPTEPGAINGGIYRKTDPAMRPVNYVNVESVDEYVAKAKSLGAQVLIEKQEVPGMGLFAQLTDPQGNIFALWQDTAHAGG